MTPAELSTRLHRSATDWTLTSVRRIAEAISGSAPSVVKKGRETHDLPGGGTLSVYHEGEEVLFLEGTLAHRHSRLTSEDERASIEAEFTRQFENAVTETEKSLGPPAFKGAIGTPGFPDDQDALCLARWPAGIGQIMVQLRHEDDDTPYRLCVSAWPENAPTEAGA